MILLENKNSDAAYFFSIEEFLVRKKKFRDPVFMIWHVDTCIMVGNNQVVEAEVNLDFLAERGIPIVRRQSGGGTIYVDAGTVLCTLVCPLENDAKTHMEDFAQILIDALTKMGVSAYRDGKNDILLDGKKIVGMAQFAVGSFICTHASLLYDTDLDVLTKILIPNDNKLIPKGIRSIRSRVTNIKPSMRVESKVEQFRAELKNGIIDNNTCKNYDFTPDELAEIDVLYADYRKKSVFSAC